MRAPIIPLSLTLALALAGCTIERIDATPTISGTLVVTDGFPGVARLGRPLPNLSGDRAAQSAHPGAEARIMERRSAMLSQLDRAELVPGDVIVAFRQEFLPASGQPRAELLAAGLPLHAQRALGPLRTHLYRAEGADRRRTIEIIEELNQRADVLYAQPNYIVHSLRVPNDEYFPLQWHYPALNLPEAWDVTVGSSSTVVAVVDSGILFHATEPSLRHPDFDGKILPGFDFISDPNDALDGDGRDGNPFDEGGAGDHGSHVAGTIAAATDNGLGVAGVDWSARILPVRALGAGGGSTEDILAGVLWAAGFELEGLPVNANPAGVINLSLGGAAPCSPLEQQVYDAVIATGVIVVVAAGNENQDAAGFSPASCTGVITVGATDFAGDRAPYSNFGSRIDVMAPGGDLGADLDGNELADGVLSIIFNDTLGFSFEFYQGTSMAAPHVAGVVSLMKGLRPELTAQEAAAILRDTARPLSAAACHRASAGDCGAGLVDAAAAVRAADGPVRGPGLLAFQPNLVNFDTGAEITVIITNTGSASVSWAAIGYEASASNPAELPNEFLGVIAGGTMGTLDASASAQMTLGLDRSQISVPGQYSGDLIFDVDGEEQRLPMRFSISGSTPKGPNGPTVVFAFMEGKDGEPEIVNQQERDGFFAMYRLETRAGENFIVAWTDQNRSGELDAGDYFGASPAVIAKEGYELRDLDIAFQPYFGTSATGDSMAPAIARALHVLRARQ